MTVKETIESQYLASLEMLRQAVLRCSPALWLDATYSNPFWHVVYHALFYTHLYLHPNREEYVYWEKGRRGYHRLSGEEAKAVTPYTPEELLEFLALCQAQVGTLLENTDLEAVSGFDWLPFNKLELQFYNLRHLMQHVGELCERLGAHGEVEVPWVGIRPG